MSPVRRMPKVLALLLAMICSDPAISQEILLDHPLQCGDLICYPVSNQEHGYYYLTATPRLARGEDGIPQFSFLRYVTDEVMGDSSDAGQKIADGGGVIHFLISLETTGDEKEEALESLRTVDKDAQLLGPVTYKSGTYQLVSAIATKDENAPDNRQTAYAVLGSGQAPLIEGLKIAVSIHLNKRGTEILLASFQTATPDISIVFTMTYDGVYDPVEATITADWTKVQERSKQKSGLSSVTARLILVLILRGCGTKSTTTVASL